MNLFRIKITERDKADSIQSKLGKGELHEFKYKVKNSKQHVVT
jgi:hypothetical protein